MHDELTGFYMMETLVLSGLIGGWWIQLSQLVFTYSKTITGFVFLYQVNEWINQKK